VKNSSPVSIALQSCRVEQRSSGQTTGDLVLIGMWQFEMFTALPSIFARYTIRLLLPSYSGGEGR
jgi:hypothetical protein